MLRPALEGCSECISGACVPCKYLQQLKQALDRLVVAGRAHAVRARHHDVSLWQWFYDLLSSLHHRTPKCRATIKLLPDLQGCHDWAADEFERCKKRSPSQPFRL